VQITALNLQKTSHIHNFVSMKITLLLVGKTAFPYINEGIALYEKRLGHYINYARVEIPELKNVQALSQEQIKEREGELILKNIKNTDDVILLDERGEILSSPALSEKMQRAFENSKNIVFVVGGAFGHFSPEMQARADLIWSFSKLVFPHQICRLILTEQIYRAQEIYLGHPYHHA
jgi:23S rRNA (pseudouridine1915-N3)-methyltransferase